MLLLCSAVEWCRCHDCRTAERFHCIKFNAFAFARARTKIRAAGALAHNASPGAELHSRNAKIVLRYYRIKRNFSSLPLIVCLFIYLFLFYYQLLSHYCDARTGTTQIARLDISTQQHTQKEKRSAGLVSRDWFCVLASERESRFCLQLAFEVLFADWPFLKLTCYICLANLKTLTIT